MERRTNMTGNKYLMSATEISRELDVSKGHAYKLIRELNRELVNAGYVIIAGKIPRTYWETKFFGYEQMTKGA